MRKCIRVIIQGVSQAMRMSLCQALRSIVHSEGGVEGSAYPEGDEQLNMLVAGDKASVDRVLDLVHQWSLVAPQPCTIHVEASVKDRDYRGVFRIIEDRDL